MPAVGTTIPEHGSCRAGVEDEDAAPFDADINIAVRGFELIILRRLRAASSQYFPGVPKYKGKIGL
jgi:hypothetical protein